LSGKAFLIVTEGEKTEPNYLKALRDRFQLNATEVEILHPEGTDPITLTKKAIELRETRRKSAKKGFAIAYDEVWVVFDLEKPHDERRKLAVQAMGMKEATGIRFAVSDPCFEFWLLLHGEYTTSPFPDCDSVMKRLEKHWPAYSKGHPPSLPFLEKLPVAVTNAQRCREHHTTSGGDGNPSTKVDILAKSLNDATRSHLQFQLV
jgi:hypothetical protein